MSTADELRMLLARIDGSLAALRQSIDGWQLSAEQRAEVMEQHALLCEARATALVMLAAEEHS